MGEQKTIQKNWTFKPATIQELEAICASEMRSQQNMVEVLIHRYWQESISLKEESRASVTN